MLVQATFLAICFAAVLFLLRFFFALDAEMRAERMRAKATVEHVTAFPGGSGILASPVVRSKPWPHSSHDAMDASAKFSQLRRA